MENLKNLLIDIFADPKSGYLNEGFNAKMKNDYARETGYRLPDKVKVNKYPSSKVRMLGQPKQPGWEIRVNIPPRAQEINPLQYMVDRKDIIPYSDKNKSLARMLMGKAIKQPLNIPLIVGGFMVDNYQNKERAKELSRQRINALKDFHTGPAYISYPDTAEGRVNRWATQLYLGE